MAHNVLLEETYRGPLDLLLYLVKRDEIDIHDIPISHLTREYLAEFAKLKTIDVEQASEFMSLAAMLIEIKSRMLLPLSEADADSDEEDIFDPRSGLVEALLEYKRFKEAAAILGERAEEFAQRIARVAPRPAQPEVTEDDSPEENDLGALFHAFQKLSRFMQQPTEIHDEEIPTSVRLAQIMTAVTSAGRTVFSKLLSDRPNAQELVGFFIALMELIRTGKVNARQTEDFSDIHIEPRQVNAEGKSIPSPLFNIPDEEIRLTPKQTAEQARPQIPVNNTVTVKTATDFLAWSHRPRRRHANSEEGAPLQVAKKVTRTQGIHLFPPLRQRQLARRPETSRPQAVLGALFPRV